MNTSQTPSNSEKPETPDQAPAAAQEDSPESASGGATPRGREPRVLIGSQRDLARRVLAPTPARLQAGGWGAAGGTLESGSMVAESTPALSAAALPSPGDVALPPSPATAAEGEPSGSRAAHAETGESQRATGGEPTAPAGGETPASPHDRRRRGRRSRGTEGSAAAESSIDLPRERVSLPPMSDDEIEEALRGVSIEQLLAASSDDATAELVAESRVKGTVARVHGDDVFLNLSRRAQGVVSLRQFAAPPAVGEEVEVVVRGFNEAEGFYDVSVPGASIVVGDWSDLVPGAVVEARVTGFNSGGLECLVQGLRGFIPASQVALYRVEQLGDFVQQKLVCVVTEAHADREKLVLSHRAILEREREARRAELLQTLQPGETREGVVTRLMDFGAFVDLGGIEGLVHISKLSWDRVSDASQIVKVGQRIKVKVEKVAEGGKISLSYRDTLQDPWENIEQRYPANSVFRGRVTRLAQFGAFVKLEPGIEGLVHISELAHHRVFAVKNVVQEGDEVDVKVLSIDRENQRMSLSIRGASARPEKAAPAADAEPEEPAGPRPEPVVPRSSEPLKGGLPRRGGGESFGLNW